MIPTNRAALLNKIVFMGLGTLVIFLSSLVVLFIPSQDRGAWSGYTEIDRGLSTPTHIEIQHEVLIREYFRYMDSLVASYQAVVPYTLSEHLLVHANPWIIDTLANTDYYRMTARDSFVYDQRKLQVFQAGDRLEIPSTEEAAELEAFFEELKLDINIPEFRLRIFKADLLLHDFPVRVGQNTTKYLAMGDRLTDLRTKTGKGTIIRHAKDPDFYNPVNHKQFFTTKRDDGRRTLMPQIPWIETEINGMRHGQMIHPTTNPETLGKAYSNGCIGTREADAWIIYYHALIGTPIEIRYDLSLPDGSSLHDIYELNQ